MPRNEIKETLNYFYYPLKTNIEQCRAIWTILNRQDLQKFENEAFGYATIHTEDSLKDMQWPYKRWNSGKIISFINSDIGNYEEILTELIETCFAGTNSHQSKAIGAQVVDLLMEIPITYWRPVLRQQQWIKKISNCRKPDPKLPANLRTEAY